MSVPANAPILTSAAMRDAEQMCAAEGTSLAELMERAGEGVADIAWRMAAGAPVLILAGPGNNGGDGYVAARLLAARGANVRVAALAPPATDLACAACSAWGGAAESIAADLKSAPVIVDALFGVGLSRPLADDLAATLARLAKGASRIIAVDVPSGIDGDGAHDWPAPFCADVTIALGALKPAHVLLPSASACGQVMLATIGVAADRTMRTLPAVSSGVPGPEAHKYSRGMALVRAGAMSGAAELAAAAALRAGAGYVILNAGERALYAAIISESRDKFIGRLGDPRLGAVVMGVGYPAGDDLDADVAAILNADKPAVFDAAAINSALPRLRQRSGNMSVILTPHAGEFARAFPDLTGSKIDRARAAAEQSNAVVIYKGADTIIAAPDGRIVAAWPGFPWLATAGTGDVLAGACGAMLARGGDIFNAAVAAVGWHVDRARACDAGLVADDLIGQNR